MIMKKLLLGLLLFIGPLPAAAQTALLLDEDTALFTITFSVDDSDFVTEIPLIAKHGIAYTDRVDEVGYTIAGSKEDATSIDLISGIVLATTPLTENLRYEVATSTPTTFTLLILANFSEPPASGSYQARITKLPYWLDGRRTTVHQNQLDDLARPVLEIK